MLNQTLRGVILASPTVRHRVTARVDVVKLMVGRAVVWRRLT